MILLPAIDILGGRAVRLVQGRFDDATTYHDDPLEAARAWVRAGAGWLHVVDLDGARAGEPRSLEAIRRIAAEAGVPVQAGGGLRSIEAIEAAFEAGVERVVLGTAAFRDVDLLDEALARWGARVLVGVDSSDGKVATAGWTEVSDLPAEAAIERLQDRGVSGIVYTSIARDGMLDGPDPEEVARVADAVRGRFIYSGGIGTLDHLRALRDMRRVNMAGVIVGKALYEQRFTVTEAAAALAG